VGTWGMIVSSPGVETGAAFILVHVTLKSCAVLTRAHTAGLSHGVIG
jgi:hypothetical protein